MLLFIIFLMMDVSVVAVFWAVYGRIGTYREGMLLGVHIPSYRERDKEVQALMAKYRKHTKWFYIWNLAASIAGSFLCFWYYSAFMVFWSIWLLELIVGSQYLIYKNHRRLYDIKVEKEWQGGVGSRHVLVNMSAMPETVKSPVSTWFHLPVFLLMGVLLLPSGVRGYLHKGKDGMILFGICFTLSVLFILLNHWTLRQEAKVYSEDDRINSMVSQMEKRTWTVIWMVCSYLNLFALALLANGMDKNDWLSNIDYMVFIVLQMIPAALVLTGVFYSRWKKEKILKTDAKPVYVDDDVFWKNGWYSNPSDPKIWVQDRFCSSNFTVNVGRPAGRIWAVSMAAITLCLFIWISVIFIRMDLSPVTLQIEGNRVEITGATYDDDFTGGEILGVGLLDALPADAQFHRTNGLADGDKMIGKFREKELGTCRLYIYKNYTPVLHIELKDYHVYMNSKKEGETKRWYGLLKEAGY